MIEIPKEILEIKQWTHSWGLGPKDLKRPKDTLYRTDGAMTYLQAKAAATKMSRHALTGFYVTQDDPYILGDIDHVDFPMDQQYLASILPVPLAAILFGRSVYSEVSPSGYSIRFIAKLKNVATKQKLEKSYFKNHVDMGICTEQVDKNGKPIPREAQVNIGRPWMTITGNKTPWSSDRISELSLSDLEKVFKLKYKGDGIAGADYTPPVPKNSGVLPTIQTMIQAIRRLPWDQNPRFLRSYKRTFGDEEYTDYEYWLKVLMAASDYAARIGVSDPNSANVILEEINKWSAKDPSGKYGGEEEVITKWQSFMQSEKTVTFHTLLSLDWHSKLNWPQGRNPTDVQIEAGFKDKIPMPGQYSNFKTLVDYYGLKLYRDEQTSAKLYLSGDQDILDKYFTHLDAKMWHGKYCGPYDSTKLTFKLSRLCQDHNFINLSPTQIKHHIGMWIAEINEKVNMTRIFFETPFDNLVEEYRENKNHIPLSTVEYLFDCLTIEYQTPDHAKERALYFRYYKSWLMGMARNIYDPSGEIMNNCILLLTGPEQIRKTSHFQRILPKFMRQDRVVSTSHEFSSGNHVRDIHVIAAQSNLMIWDEIERYLDSKTESNFKSMLDNKPTKFRDKYEVIPSYVVPIASYGATSNQREFNLSDNGSRRIFHIPVSYVDTSRMDNVNWWKIINDLYDELRSAPATEPPWLLTEDELVYQAELHRGVTAKSGLDILVSEMFCFEERFPIPPGGSKLPDDFNFRSSEYLWSITDLGQRIRGQSHNVERFTTAHLVKVIERLCGAWSGTMKNTISISRPNITINRGKVSMASTGPGKPRSKYWMPSIRVNERKLQGYFSDDAAKDS